MEMAQDVEMVLEFDAIPLLPGALDAYNRGFRTGANRPNQDYCGESLTLDTNLTPHQQELLFDPQTSGGLLVALPKDQAVDALASIVEGGDNTAAIIGHVHGSGHGIRVV